MFQSIMKSLKLDALPDGGRKLRDEVLFLSENLRQLNIQINNSDRATQTGTFNGRDLLLHFNLRHLLYVMSVSLFYNGFTTMGG